MPTLLTTKISFCEVKFCQVYSVTHNSPNIWKTTRNLSTGTEMNGKAKLYHHMFQTNFHIKREYRNNSNA